MKWSYNGKKTKVQGIYEGLTEKMLKLRGKKKEKEKQIKTNWKTEWLMTAAPGSKDE